MKLVFMGTSNFSLGILKALQKEHEILAVFTQEDQRRGRGKKLQAPPVKEFSLEKKIPCFQDHPKVEELKQFPADILVVAAYGRLLPQEILELYPFGALNVHTSLLPRYRGASPIQAALLHGDEETGVTMMKMNQKMDQGDVYGQATLPTLDLRYGELEEELLKLSIPLLLDTLKDIHDGKAVPQKQEEDKASYCKKIQKKDTQIDWGRSAKEIEGAVRAYWPSPMAFTMRRGERLLLHRVKAVDILETKEPGAVEKVDDQGIYVATGQGMILIEELQRPGKRALNSVDYLRGNPFQNDEKLGG